MRSEFSSCISPKPLVALEGETARAAILNYNLPSSTTFRVRNYIQIQIPDHFWNAEALRSEEGPHTALEKPARVHRDPELRAEKARAQLERILQEPPKARKPPEVGPNPGLVMDPFAGNCPEVLVEMAVQYPALRPLLALHQPEQYFANIAGASSAGAQFSASPSAIATRALPLASPSADGASRDGYLRQAEAHLGTTVSEVSLRAAYGELPVFQRTLYGNYRTNYVKITDSRARPTLVLIEEYEVASYLGDYGAGKTLKTFSLLPGEKTTISVKTYRTATENRSQTENILDSFSQQSADTLETMINDELASSESSSSASSTGFTSTETWQQQGSVSASAGLSLKLLSAKGSGSYSWGHSDTDVNTSTSNSSRASTTSGLKKSMDRHVAQSEAARKVEVNTETQQSVSTTTGEEQSTVREIQNINHSRVLNFVFRQLCQEYVTVTYLNDVSFGFTKGYLGDGRTEGLDNLETLLRSVLKPRYVDAVLTTLIDELANVYDHNGHRFSFVKRESEEVFSLVHPEKKPIKRRYFRKDPELAQSWDDSGKTVKGIILDVSRRILTTDAVIVEALLGQGEALDCYNQRLQNAAADRADLENAEREQAIGIIDAVEGATEKADLYKKVFGTDPQTIVQGVGQ